MTPACSAAALASHSQTAGRRTGPPASDPWPRPWITSKRTRPARRGSRDEPLQRAQRSRAPAPVHVQPRVDGVRPAAQLAQQLGRDVARAPRDLVARLLDDERSRRRRRAAVLRRASAREGDGTVTRAGTSLERPRAAHRLSERAIAAIIVVAAMVGRRHRAAQSLRNASTTWLATFPFGSRRPRSSTPSNVSLVWNAMPVFTPSRPHCSSNCVLPRLSES